MNIEPGYLLKVTTWENDADNYNTWEKDGLSEDDVRFYLLVANLFKSDHLDADALGNKDVPRYDSDVSLYDERIDQLLVGFRANGGVVPTDWDKLADPAETENFGIHFYDELVSDMIGIWCEGEYYRVYESHQVIEIPEPGLKDVTEKFANV